MMLELKAPKMYYMWNVLLTLALAAIALIPAAMAYNVRTFSATHIPEWLAQAVAITILVAPSAAVFVIGMTRTFAVSDEAHAEAMKNAIILEAVACVFEIIAALAVGDDWLARATRVLFLSLATVSSFAAIGLALTANGFYRMITERNALQLQNARSQRELQELQARNNYAEETARLKAQLELIQSDDTRKDIQDAYRHKIRDDMEKIIGRQLWDRPIHAANENGSKKDF